MLCLRKPQDYYGLAPQTIIHMLNVAASAPQAHGVFFKPMRTLFVNSPWFADKFEGGMPPGPQAQSIRFIKQIEMVSGHSEAESLEGKNLLAAIADEISAFPTAEDAAKRGKMPNRTADGVIDMLRSSSTTRFPFTRKVAQISYPRSQGDAIMKAMREAKLDNEVNGEKSTYFASGPHRTWDVNPLYSPERGMEYVTIPGIDGTVPNVPQIVNDYKQRPAYARAKYECKPSVSENPYFQDRGMIHAAFSRELPVEPLTLKYYYGVDATEGEVRPSWQVDFQLNNLAPIPGALYTIHADMAINGDRAGIAMSHVQEYREVVESGAGGITDVRTEQRPVVKVDFVTAFEADETAHVTDDLVVPREIQIRWFRKLVVLLANAGFTIVSVSMDGFQSADSLQILRARGYEAQLVSVDRNDHCWKTLRDVMYDSRLLGYNHPLVIQELEGLTKVGKKIDHPASGSKDLVDAIAASVTKAVEAGGQEESAISDLTLSPSTLSTQDSMMPFSSSGFGDTMGSGLFGSGPQGMPSGLFGN